MIFRESIFITGFPGFIARRLKQESELGTIIDPIADKLLMTTAFIMLTIPGMLGPGRHLPVPFWVTAAVIGRDIAIIAVALPSCLLSPSPSRRSSSPSPSHCRRAFHQRRRHAIHRLCHRTAITRLCRSRC